MKYRFIRSICFLAVTCTVLLSSTLTHSASREYALKAAFIEKFTRFINWPLDSPVHKPDTIFSICVTGKNPFNGVLEKIARLSTIKNKPVQVKQIDVIDNIGECQILFIAATKNITLKKILQKTKGQPILTISDTPGYAQLGIMINFYPRDNSIGFEINKQASEMSRLAISSRLLKLSRIIESNGDSP